MTQSDCSDHVLEWPRRSNGNSCSKGALPSAARGADILLEPLVDVALEPLIDVPLEPTAGALGATSALLGAVLPENVLGGLP